MKSSYAECMKALALAALACLALCGCKKPDPEAATTDSPASTASASKGGGGGSGDGITPVGPNVGPMTPVVGGDNMAGGTGGGIAQGMKDRARATQGKASSATAGEDGSGQ
jgi:hypothetical protein